MKLLIIGHSVEDHFLKGKEEEIKPGGIYYTASGFNNIKDSNDKIILLTDTEEDNYKLFSPIFDNFDRRYFQKVNSIPKVFLKIHEEEERDECYNKVTENLKINLENMDSFDGILINMITGFDISLEQLISIRKAYKGLIYFDVHTLSRGIDNEGRRTFRIIPEFNKWAENIDIIQVNKHELLTLSNKTEQLEIVKEILDCGTKYVILTLEELGARIFFLNESEINSIFKPAIKIEVKNKVGCGDIFGAVFFYNYIKYRDINVSLEAANKAAGLAASNNDLMG